MATLKIVGYETGKAKMDVVEILCDRLGLEGDEAQKMRDHVVSGQGLSLDFDTEETAVGLGQELDEAGAMVRIEP